MQSQNLHVPRQKTAGKTRTSTDQENVQTQRTIQGGGLKNYVRDPAIHILPLTNPTDLRRLQNIAAPTA